MIARMPDDYLLLEGDCLERMKEIADGSIDLVLADPPYGTTACKWDSIIPLEPMWEQLERVAKKNAAIVMTASQPFTTTLIASNMKMFKYCWVWEKSKPSGFMNAKARPLKTTEDVVVYSSARCDAAGGARNMVYIPQGVKEVETKKTNSDNIRAGMRSRQKGPTYTQTQTGYPRGILRIPNEGKTVHPTQKPVALMEYLIKTYTNEGETVLDFTMGSGTTGVAARQCNRRFIGIEKDPEYFQIASSRIFEAEMELIA